MIDPIRTRSRVRDAGMIKEGRIETRRGKIGEPRRIFVNKVNADLLSGTESALGLEGRRELEGTRRE